MNQISTATVSIDLTSVQLTVPAEELFRAWLQQQVAKPVAVPGFAVPALNEGERYAGIIMKDGKPSHHLILLGADGGELPWVDAKEWAASVGGELPTRAEQSLLFANCKDAFELCWHWSCEAYDPSDAWCQHFYDGSQGYDYVVSKLRARAVRRDLFTY